MAGFIEVEGILISVNRKKGAKSVRLKMNPKTGKPELSLPFLYPLFMAERFVKAHLVWLQKQVEMMPGKQKFEDGQRLLLLGKELTICHDSSLKRGVFIKEETLYVSGEKSHLHRRVKDFIKEQVKAYAFLKATEYAKRFDKKIGRISIKDTVSRWGSCSSTGTLSFCWRLGLAPLMVFDYVIAHEVTHLEEMNHSWAFWKKLGLLDGHVNEAKKWLSVHAKDLHKYE